MITRKEMILTLIESCPAFAQKYEADLAQWAEDEKPADYLVLGDFVRYVISHLEEGHHRQLEEAFAVIERLHREGDAYVREAATIGILEGLQNTNLHTDTKPEQFLPLLRPESLRYWHKAEAFWENGTIIKDD